MGRAQRKVKREEASLEGLDEVFSGDEIQNESNVDGKNVEMLFQDDSEQEQSEPEAGTEPEAREETEGESPVSQAESSQSENSQPVESSHTEVARREETGISAPFVDADDRVSRRDLLNILEGFTRLLKRDGEPNLPLSEDLRYTEVDIEDKTAELEDMRRLVIEAQETIIKLLTDRVEDRARIATLETELRLLPDLQEQADRAMAVAFKTEEFRTELHKVKFELEKNRIAAVRRDMYSGPKGVLTRVRRWFLKGSGRGQLQFKEEMERLSRKS
ncbi:MAG: hypothetical protein KC777_06090 [Cyanobacteria bacterium HKST-UBA02]|nr:hypothetical protein [Cyanobacteria bacterium HKST-UBA02]